MKKYVVLLSAGLDSTVNLYEAYKAGEILLALTFDYGQRAALKEISAAKRISQELGVPHQVLPLPFFSTFGKSSLIDRSQTLPQGADVSIDDLQVSQKTAQSVWVPNRNGIFLNVAAGFAESLGADAIVPGFNLEEAATFPDNTNDFLEQVTRSLSFSTANRVQATCFTTGLRKTEIVKRGEELNVSWKNIWPCYQNFELWCGQCESCLRSRRAFSAAGVQAESLFLKSSVK